MPNCSLQDARTACINFEAVNKLDIQSMKISNTLLSRHDELQSQGQSNMRPLNSDSYSRVNMKGISTRNYKANHKGEMRFGKCLSCGKFHSRNSYAFRNANCFKYVFSKVDLEYAYLRNPFDQSSSILTTINTPFDLFKCNFLPCSLSCSPAIFQEVMNEIVSDLEGAEVYQDDLIVHGPNKKANVGDPVLSNEYQDRAKKWYKRKQESEVRANEAKNRGTMMEVDCGSRVKLEVDFENIQSHGISYKKATVRKTTPVNLVFNVIAERKPIEIESIDWTYNNVSINIGDNDNQDIYYSTEKVSSGFTITLHMKAPTSRVAGTWILTVNAKDNSKHVGFCYISSQPVIRSRFGAVRGHEGNPLSVLCEVDGFPEPNQVVWRRVIENEDDATKNRLVSVSNAMFKPHESTKDAIMEWTDASDATGFYMCTATSTLGSDSLLLEVRIKSKD
ncbi:unnamed protein product [Schistosoma mattheei]|uniref:Uncharacterized protein n=2 Tax=Schistosoma TaxID=6181 RepID=A0A183PFS5_9TREM|nr:unnamed protein product [Schistosoma mattheei]